MNIVDQTGGKSTSKVLHVYIKHDTPVVDCEAQYYTGLFKYSSRRGVPSLLLSVSESTLIWNRQLLVVG